MNGRQWGVLSGPYKWLANHTNPGPEITRNCVWVQRWRDDTANIICLGHHMYPNMEVLEDDDKSARGP